MRQTETGKPWSFNEEGDVFFLNTTEPPRDWLNLHFAEQGQRAYYSLFNHAGAGPVFVRDEEGNKTFLTNEKGDRTVYFRREDTGQVWTIAGYPAFQSVEGYRCECAPAHTRIESQFEGIACSQRMFVPLDRLFEIWTIEIANHTAAPKTISLFPFASIDLTGFPILFRYGKNRMRWTTYHDEIQGLFTQNRSPFAPSDIYRAFLISSEKVSAATGKPGSLFTPPYSFARPNLDGEWKDRFVSGYDENCMCLKATVTVAAGGKKTVNFAFGTAAEVERIQPVLHLIQDPSKIDGLLAEVAQYHKSMRSRIQLKTGAERIDRYINNWAPKQIESYLVFKKAFRDNLQVDMAYCSLNYEKALANVLDALSHQYEDGHAPHSFRPLVPIQYSDKPAWILMAVPELIKESGDFSILDIELPYIDPAGRQTTLREPVLGHMRRAMRFLFDDIGAHQINRMHYADWLDGLDGLSRVGEGESVLTSMMFAAGLLEMIRLAAAMRDEALRREAADMHRQVKKRINDNAWDGEWCLRGFSGNGEKVGSKENKYGQIFLNPQSWAVIADVADEERRRSLLASIDARLETDLGRRLYYPSYKEYFHHIGCISAQPPDFAMNAIYNHACAFSLVAECLAGRNEKAWDVLEKIVPNGDKNPSTQSKNEPFSITNSFKLEKNYYGEAGEPWRTGTAGWVYRGLVEFIVGVRKDYRGLTINPCLPARIATASLRRTFRGNIYHIELDNHRGANRGFSRILVNGEEIGGNVLPLGKQGAEHHVEVIL